MSKGFKKYKGYDSLVKDLEADPDIIYIKKYMYDLDAGLDLINILTMLISACIGIYGKIDRQIWIDLLDFLLKISEFRSVSLRS